MRILQIDIKSWDNIIISTSEKFKTSHEKYMGLLSDMGPLLSFEQGDKLQPVLKKIAIRQFLKVLQKYRKWKKPSGIQ